MITPELAELLAEAMDARVNQIRTAQPGKVISYNKSRNTVDVEPQFLNVTVDPDTGEVISSKPPNIPDVPIAWPRGGGHSITFPLAKGDTVLLVICDRDLGLWRSVGQQGTTGDLRHHGLSGAVAFPSLAPNSGALGSSRVADDAVVLATKVLLGSSSAAEAIPKGNAYTTELISILNQIATAVNGLGGAVVSTPWATALNNALSSKHKIDS